MRNNFMLNMRFSSGLPGCPRQDMKLSVSNRFAWSKAGGTFRDYAVRTEQGLFQGLVRLRDKNPESEPIVAFNLMSDPRDLRRTMDAVRFAVGVLQTPPARDLAFSIFPGVYGEMIRNLTTQSRVNKVVTDLAAHLLDVGGVARKLVMSLAMKSKLTIDDLVQDDRKLEDWIHQGVQGDWHACGTCKMGAARGSRRRGRPRGPGLWGGESAGGRCLHHAHHPRRQYQYQHDHDRREDGRHRCWAGARRGRGRPSARGRSGLPRSTSLG